MITKLAEVFVERNIIEKDTELQVNVRKKSLSGVYIESPETIYVTDIITNKTPEFVGVSAYDGTEYRIKSSSVLYINGMEPTRLARIFSINEDGTLAPKGKKRGRKRKNTEYRATR